jgi:hypothetical protein
MMTKLLNMEKEIKRLKKQNEKLQEKSTSSITTTEQINKKVMYNFK